MIRPLLFILCFGSALPALCAPLSLQQGQTVTLAEYYELRNCLAQAAPGVRLLQNPTLGMATVVQTRGTTGGSGRCGYVAVPIAQVRYYAERPGQDLVRWEIRYQARGRPTETGVAHIVVRPTLLQ